MNNIFTKSIVYILFSFILLTFTIFLINEYYNFYSYFLIIKYSAIELLGLVLILSQIFLISIEQKLLLKHLIINAIICWVIYILCKYLLNDKNIIYFFNVVSGNIFIDRGISFTPNFNIFKINFIKNFFYDIHNWDLNNKVPYSSFNILFFNISFLNFIKNKLKDQVLFQFILILIIFLFYVYIWDLVFNIPLFLLAIIMLKGSGVNYEKL